MKIGIVTLSHGNDNYGGTLQALALQECLTRYGHSVFLCNTGPIAKEPSSSLLRQCFSRHPIRNIQELRKTFSFLEFWNRYFHYDPQGHLTTASYLKNPTPCDCLICGSDQVWANARIKHPENRAYYLLDFGKKETKRIAYAASLGAERFPKELHEQLSPLLAKFSAISVREETGIKACRELGQPGVVSVCDPTFLVPVSFWHQIADEGTIMWDKNLLFCQEYRWKTAVKQEKARRAIEKHFNLHARIPFAYKLSSLLTRTCSPTPADWLNAIRSSQCVLTNSFHCVIFSILFHKPFLLMALTGRHASMNMRFRDLLEHLGLSDRLLQNATGSIEEKMQAPIAWESVDAKLADWRKESLDFLITALEK